MKSRQPQLSGSVPPSTPSSARGFKSFNYVPETEPTAETKSVIIPIDSSSTARLAQKFNEIKVDNNQSTSKINFAAILEKLYEVDRSYISNIREHAKNTYQKKILKLQAVLKEEFKKNKVAVSVATLDAFSRALVHLATALDHPYTPPVIEMCHSYSEMDADIFFRVLYDVESHWKKLLTFDKFCALHEADNDNDVSTLQKLYDKFSEKMRIDITITAHHIGQFMIDFIDKLCVKEKRTLQLDLIVDSNVIPSTVHMKNINMLLSCSQKGGAASKLSIPYECAKTVIDKLKKEVNIKNPGVEIQVHRLTTAPAQSQILRI
ncbi:MAG: hypothetical protein ABI597_03190 [Gammaproteobacteria bacterium]